MIDPWLSQPTQSDEHLCFIADDDLWRCDVGGGAATRLTVGAGVPSRPRLSPDGRLIAVIASVGGHRELCVVSIDGGLPERRTWLGDVAAVLAFSLDERHIFIATSAREPSNKQLVVWSVPVDGGAAVRAPWGLALGLALRADGAVALCRHTDDLARWKRYRGGRTGDIWLRIPEGSSFARLTPPDGANWCAPMWLGDRLAFISERNGTGNLWSMTTDGEDLRQHTDHAGCYVRAAQQHGERVVYQHEGRIWAVALADSEPRQLPITLRPSGVATRPFAVTAMTALHGHDLHPDGSVIAAEVRGALVSGGLWEGPVLQHRVATGVRHRLPRWTPAGDDLIAVHDRDGDERLVRFSLATGEARDITDAQIGRPVDVAIDPTGNLAAIISHDHRVLAVDLSSGEVRRLDRSEAGPPSGLSWSADGAWLAWSHPRSPNLSVIRAYNVNERRSLDLTDGQYADTSPSFDPHGEWLFFISTRELDPVRDDIVFDYGFPRSTRPYALALQRSGRDPSRLGPRPLRATSPSKQSDPPPVTIDPIGLYDRVARLSVPAGRWVDVVALPQQKVLLLQAPIRSARQRNPYATRPAAADNQLYALELHQGKSTLVSTKVTDFRTNFARTIAIVRRQDHLQVAATTFDKDARELLAKDHPSRPSRNNLTIDLHRFAAEIDPRAEWRQIFAEAWRLMRDHYWRPANAPVDWHDVRDRYAPLVERLSTRAELSDLLWCMQAELGTSHAFAIGGERSASTLGGGAQRALGHLAADLSAQGEHWVFTAIYAGDRGDPKARSPLVGPAIDVAIADRLIAIDGVPTNPGVPPEALLVGKAGIDVQLTVERDGVRHHTVVRPRANDRVVRYRDRVLDTRAIVHAATDGRVGYLHIPDMGPNGFATFHQDYLRESTRDGLIVDVRHNSGGHVSQLLLATLARPRLGFNVTRWASATPWPRGANSSAMVAITDELSGSDGDIFSHAWKQLRLGPLIGQRTWGGTVGIWPRHHLIDRTLTTQPEYAIWFPDVAFGTENYGTDPDEVIAISPDDYAAGRDPQRDRAIAIAIAALGAAPSWLRQWDGDAAVQEVE